MSTIKTLFTENLLLKLMALVIAISLVVTKRDDRVIHVKKMVGLELKYPSDRILMSMLPPQIELTIEGPYQQIRRLEQERGDGPFSAYRIQFDGSENGVYNFHKDYYSLPPQLKLTAISPSSMVVTFDEKAEKRLTVSPSFVEKLPEGFRLKGQELTPDFVTAVGPKSVLDKLEKVDTQPVNLGDRQESVILEVELKDPPLFVEFGIDQPRVNLSLSIEELIEEKTFENMELEKRGVQDKTEVKVTPSRVSVNLKGPPRLLSTLTADKIQPFIDIGDIQGQGVQAVVVRVEGLPPTVKWAINPNKVSILIASEASSASGQSISDKPIPPPSNDPSRQK